MYNSRLIWSEPVPILLMQSVLSIELGEIREVVGAHLTENHGYAPEFRAFNP